jgi:hypothetical protein
LNFLTPQTAKVFFLRSQYLSNLLGQSELRDGLASSSSLPRADSIFSYTQERERETMGTSLFSNKLQPVYATKYSYDHITAFRNTHGEENTRYNAAAAALVCTECFLLIYLHIYLFARVSPHLPLSRESCVCVCEALPNLENFRGEEKEVSQQSQQQQQWPVESFLRNFLACVHPHSRASKWR